MSAGSRLKKRVSDVPFVHSTTLALDGACSGAHHLCILELFLLVLQALLLRLIHSLCLGETVLENSDIVAGVVL